MTSFSISKLVVTKYRKFAYNLKCSEINSKETVRWMKVGLGFSLRVNLTFLYLLGLWSTDAKDLLWSRDLKRLYRSIKWVNIEETAILNSFAIWLVNKMDSKVCLELTKGIWNGIHIKVAHELELFKNRSCLKSYS